MEVQPLAISAADAFRAFTEVEQQRRWVPGLKKVKLVRSDANGRALEVFYEFGETLAYALVYAWDDVNLKARWVPSSGVRDGVSGSIWFEGREQGCVMHYQLEAITGRPPEHEHDVAIAFVAWLKGR